MSRLNYFTFEPSQKVISSSADANELSVAMLFDLAGVEADEFVVRPKVSNGFVSIFDEVCGEWVSGTALWDKLPLLSKEVRLKVEGLSSERTELFFQIQHIKTTKIYETPKKYIWSDNMYEPYLAKVNENILGFGKLVDVVEAPSLSVGEPSPNFSQLYFKPLYKKTDLWGILLLFSGALLIGFFSSHLLKMLKYWGDSFRATKKMDTFSSGL
jgi:hypothetical protein